LAACDRLGLIAWEEIPIVNAITESEAFTQNSKEMLREMIRQHYNHPSVLMWGYMNEVLLQMKFKDDPDRQKQYVENVAGLARELEDVVREEDPNRTTVMAFHGNFDLYHEAGLTKIPMVLGWNLYYGWYSADFLGLGRFLDEPRKILPDKLIIISEYGAGSDTRLHAIEPKRFDFTEQWQQKYLQSYLRQMQELEFVVGGTVWNLVDFNFWNIRSGISDSTSEEVSTQPVQIYSNAKEVELRVNGRSLGSKTVQQNEANFEVPFSDGMNRLEAVANVQGQSLYDVQKIDFRLQPKKLSNSGFKEINVNVGAHHFFVDHELNQVWVPEKAYEKGSWGYIGGCIVSKHGMVTEQEATKISLEVLRIPFIRRSGTVYKLFVLMLLMEHMS